jgi:subtilase family serine protease
MARTSVLRAGFWLAALASLAGIPAASAAANGARRVGPPPHSAPGSHVLGAVPDTSSITAVVTLAPRDPAGLAAYATAVSTPGSPAFHHYLTVSQFRSLFGADSAQIGAVRDSLRRHGLSPGAASANGLSIPVTAGAGALAHAFSIGFHRLALPGGRVAFANTAAPQFDGSVAGLIQGVVGLDNLDRLHPASLSHVAAASVAAPHVVTGGPQPCSSASGIGEYTADQIASAYSLSSLYGAGDQGAGQTVALFELEPNSTTDISAYESCYGITTPVTYSKVDGGSGSGAGQGEAALDIEDVLGLAPKTSVIVYQGPNTGPGVYDTYNAMITQNKAKVISTSWGLCESSAGSMASSENTLFQEAAVQGQSIFAASGDSGSEDCGTSSLAVDDPASQPFVTGVGGTTMPTLGPPPTQSVWNNSSGAGGGGISALWTMPSYQSGAPAALNVANGASSGSPCHATNGTLCREVPDVSADADPYTGYAIYWNNRWIGIGGTSAAAPTWASFLALTNASSACAATPVGWADPALYKAAAAAYSSDFSDITSGNNDHSNQNGGRFAAGTGFDMASGLGTPIGSTLPAALCGGGGGGGGGPATVTVTNPGGQTTTAGTAVSLQIHASDSDAGALTYSATGLPSGLSINSSTGLVSGTPTSAGSWSVTVTATDASGPSGSASFSWTVNPAGGGSTCTAAQLLGNPGFETGSATPWSATAGVISPSSAGEPARTGSYDAWLDGYNSRHTDTLAQTVTVPAGCSNYTFSFWLHIDTAQFGTTVRDTLSLQVLSSSGSVLATLAKFSNVNAANGYLQHSYSLAAYAGQRVTLKFTGVQTTTRPTSFVIDDTALNVS